MTNRRPGKNQQIGNPTFHKDEWLFHPYDFAFSDIEISQEPYTIFEYLRKYDQGKIFAQPDFQSYLAWSDVKKSRFIESILLNYPIPSFYLNETIDVRYIVIDGIQRTTALLQYYKGAFALTGLKALRGLEGRTFQDLPEYLRSRFEDKKMIIYVLKPSTPITVIQDLFNRINTGGTVLNRQEIRNSIFMGQASAFLKELSEMECFRIAIDDGIRARRMMDRECILQYLAFRWFNHLEDYQDDMNEFVDEAMRRINRMESTRLYEIKNDFERVMKWSYKIWDKINFRIPALDDRGKVNAAVFQTVCYYLAGKSDSFLNRNEIILRKNYDDLITNATYIKAVTKHVYSKVSIDDRFMLAKTILNEQTND